MVEHAVETEARRKRKREQVAGRVHRALTGLEEPELGCEPMALRQRVGPVMEAIGVDGKREDQRILEDEHVRQTHAECEERDEEEPPTPVPRRPGSP